MLDPAPRRKLPTVLLIDDDLVSREVAATLLTMTGYTVYTADQGEAAVAMLATGSCLPEVVLVDAQMPGLSGVPLIAELRRRTGAVIVAISGSAIGNEIATAADGFLLKPFDPSAVERMLEERAPQPAPHASGDAIISAQTLTQLRSLMSAAAVRQIYAAVVSDLGARLEKLKAAIAAADIAEIARIGHAIKGGCGMAGAREAARLGAELEALPFHPQGNQLDNAARLLADLHNALRNLERMLDAELPA